ncbi:hypothetical protein N7466_008117 [Penicillium verhagenii]|uniref:uncharacterized protein n=1 Tax=Penicillium verhagenii TaxID=1562060 RepID=UPI002544F026|nr:uncharacterized protein N7466_008117 [Penicillium verhagenii]KAJ5923930.1 hypothetical protein N7466_008117 [Penicillium verhagenii]
MSRQALVFDGLWHSLCPSFNRLPLGRPSYLLKSRKYSSRPCPQPAIRIAPKVPRRYYASQDKEIGDSSTPDEKLTHILHSNNDDPTSSPEPKSKPQFKPNPHEADNADRPLRKPRMPLPRVPDSFYTKSAAELESMLRRMMTKQPNIIGATQILRALIRDHKTEPHTRHYQALILAHCDHQMGSPEVVQHLLQEMEENGVTADSGTLHAALKALAVHPDYILRQDVLRMLRDRWLTVSPDGWHFMVAGLLRDHQFELALDQISLMERKGTHIENWLHSMAVYQLCDFQEFDEVYRLMQARIEQGHDMTPELWAHVLKTASQALHYDLTCFIWRRMVDLGYLKPSLDIYSNALTIASEAGDIELALSIVRSCDARNFPLKAQDYQQLLHIYLRSGDLAASFKLLCTMHELGVVPAEQSIESVVSHMIDHHTDPREAWQMLKRLKNDKREIPIGCVRIIAELCENLAHDDPSVVDDAVGFYKELYTLCPEGADVHVYNILIRMCRHAQNRPSGLFLVKEMASFGIVPDVTTFESLILMCLDARNYQSAYMYLRDLLDRGDEVSDETREQIRHLCSQSVNEFAVRLQHHPAVQFVERPVAPASSVDKDSTLDQSQNTADQTGHRRYGRPWVRAAFRRQTLSDEDRIAWNKKRRQNKRRHEAIARTGESEA